MIGSAGDINTVDITASSKSWCLMEPPIHRLANLLIQIGFSSSIMFFQTYHIGRDKPLWQEQASPPCFLVTKVTRLDPSDWLPGKKKKRQ